MDTEPIQNNLESLNTLQPTEGSLPWLRQRGDLEQIRQLKNEVTDAIRKLSNYKDNPFTRKDVLGYAKLATKAGSGLLWDWVEFSRYYPYPPIEVKIDDPDRIEWVYAKKDLERNLAVIAREEAIELKNRGMNEEASSKMKLAKISFERYQRFTDTSIYYEHRGFIGELFEKAEVVNLFFDPKVESALEELNRTTYDISESKIHLQGIDSGLIRVWSSCSPPMKDFPFVHEEYEKLRRYIADKNNVAPEDIKRLTSWKINEMFPDQ